MKIEKIKDFILYPFLVGILLLLVQHFYFDNEKNNKRNSAVDGDLQINNNCITCNIKDSNEIELKKIETDSINVAMAKIEKTILVFIKKNYKDFGETYTYKIYDKKIDDKYELISYSKKDNFKLNHYCRSPLDSTYHKLSLQIVKNKKITQVILVNGTYVTNFNSKFNIEESIKWTKQENCDSSCLLVNSQEIASFDKHDVYFTKLNFGIIVWNSFLLSDLYNMK